MRTEASYTRRRPRLIDIIQSGILHSYWYREFNRLTPSLLKPCYSNTSPCSNIRSSNTEFIVSPRLNDQPWTTVRSQWPPHWHRPIWNCLPCQYTFELPLYWLLSDWSQRHWLLSVQPSIKPPLRTILRVVLRTISNHGQRMKKKIKIPTRVINFVWACLVCLSFLLSSSVIVFAIFVLWATSVDEHLLFLVAGHCAFHWLLLFTLLLCTVG